MEKSDIDLFNVREFLFSLIKQEFGYGYVPEFHEDIINLESFYITPEKNAFIIAIDNEKKKLVGTLGVRSYDKDFESFKDRYNPSKTASFWRTFVLSHYRRIGLASSLVKFGENFCHDQEFHEIYLHTHKIVPGSLEFWMCNGYNIIEDTQNERGTVHMEKILSKPINYSKGLLKQKISSKFEYRASIQ
ncbi:GNAT family N-acetyltransferase [Methanobacterium alcaliphilum]|uniref:GNAT family N-acetyltransferase n=1 Tax=Methanobacterium alcaliphilum TaxID=392018 RepID=UPI00200A8F6F|nr:GNAT family N-acetyltransferase [Methanobacterium alcaliphilum]MCK9152054.1 GNAT family N-acetyltransferase [Methanobacterium alcaliphilum]